MCVPDSPTRRNDEFASPVPDVSKPFHCVKCQRSYGSKGALLRHVKYECQNVRLFSCPMCPKTFKRSCHAKNHVRIVHSMSGDLVPSFPDGPFVSPGLDVSQIQLVSVQNKPFL